jgi:hypothetical protein
MLPFGSLLSQIPLLVLAFAYLIYFGATAVNKTASGNEPDLTINKVQIVKKTPVSTRTRNVFYYHALKGRLNITGDTFENNHFQCLVILPRYVPDKIFSHYEGCNLFSKPPPFPLG